MWTFIKSASKKENWLKHELKEICFIGRSNVGKSTLINTLSKNNKLAKVSKTPGRTQLINYFQANENLIVVDLPGYGFAKISKEKQEHMFNMVDEYFQNSKPNYVFLLFDSRHGMQKQDTIICNYLNELNHNIILIGTKADKATQSEISKALNNDLLKKYQYFLIGKDNKKQINNLFSFINSI